MDSIVLMMMEGKQKTKTKEEGRRIKKAATMRSKRNMNYILELMLPLLEI